MKTFWANNAGLYLSVVLTKIDSEVLETPAARNKTGDAANLLSESGYSLSSIFANVNPKDGRFLKYVPDGFLNEQQKDAKIKALQKQANEYASELNDHLHSRNGGQDRTGEGSNRRTDSKGIGKESGEVRPSKKDSPESKVDRLYSLSPAAKQREAEAERRKAYAAKKPETDRLTSLSSAANQLPERESDIRFSKKDYIDQVDAVKNNTHDPMNHVYMGTTPQGLVNILGLPKLPMLITPNHVYSLAVSEAQAKAENRFRKGTNYHDMGWDRVRNLPEDIGQPVVIIKSNADPNDVRFVVVTDKLDKAGDPIIAAVRPNGEGKYFGIDFASSVLLSSYGKENFRNYLSTAKTENRILYVDKKRSHPKKNGPGLQLSNAILSVDFSDSLSQFRDLVNRKFAGTAFAM